VAAGGCWVELPVALDRKYRNAGRKWPWHWVFPPTRNCMGKTTEQVCRHHVHETVLQCAVREATAGAGLSKRAECHTCDTHSRRI
jgi:hypothetical protein